MSPPRKVLPRTRIIPNDTDVVGVARGGNPFEFASSMLGLDAGLGVTVGGAAQAAVDAAQNAALAAETAARTDADIAERNARIAADNAEATARAHADTAETTARLAGDALEHTGWTTADAVERAERIAADELETAARIAGDAAIVLHAYAPLCTGEVPPVLLGTADGQCIMVPIT